MTVWIVFWWYYDEDDDHVDQIRYVRGVYGSRASAEAAMEEGDELEEYEVKP